MTFNDNVENYRNDRVDKRLSPVKRRMFNDDESTSKLENYRNDHNKRIKTSLDADKYGRELGHNSRNSKTSASSSDSSQLPRLQNHIPSSSSPQSPSIESSITSPSSSLEKSLDAGCDSGNAVEDFNNFDTWFKQNKCEIGISHLNCFCIEDYLTIQEMPIVKRFDNDECVKKNLICDYNISKKMVGKNLTRNRLIALLMHSKEKCQIKYLAKIAKEATGK